AERYWLDPCRHREAFGEHEVRLVRHDDQVIVLVEADARVRDARPAEGRHRTERRVAVERAVAEVGATHVAVVEAQEALSLLREGAGGARARVDPAGPAHAEAAAAA